jgi:23S rRNA pseudouridine2605 synthase
VSVNGAPAALGTRVTGEDQVRLDGRLVRQRAPTMVPVLLCHRSPGVPLLPERARRTAPEALAPAPAVTRAAPVSLAERLPRRAGRRFVSIGPMPTVDGGLELLTSDGELAARLQRAVRGLEVEFSVRVRGELSEQQQQGIRDGLLDRGTTLRVLALEPSGGEGSNRWYRLLALGASGNDLRALIERQAVTLVRVLRTRLGTLELPRTLARDHWRALSAEELAALQGPRA